MKKLAVLSLAVAAASTFGCSGTSVDSPPTVAPSFPEGFELVEQEASTVPNPVLVATAEAVVEASDTISEFWPGFWEPGQSFVLVDALGGEAALAVSGLGPLDGFSPVSDAPLALEGRASYRVAGWPESATAQTVSLGTFTGYVLPVPVTPGRDVPKQAGYVIHETFHYHQRGDRAFALVEEDSIVGMVPTAFIDDTGFASDPDWLAQLAVEDSMLTAIARETDLVRLRSSLRAYIAARDARLSERVDLRRVERRYERFEGTAEYVGCRAQAVVGGLERYIPCITEDLGVPAEETETFPGGTLGYLARWRLYSSGAVLSDALDRLAVEDWRGRVAGGTHLDVLVRDTVSD